MKSLLKFSVFIMGVVLAQHNIYAQGPATIKDSIYSKVLNEQRKLNIYLPEEYDPESNVKYDVLYITDGEIHFEDFVYIYKFAKKEGFIPPLILVSIPNIYTLSGNMRDRDFLPEKTTDNARAGGADNFIAFLRDELIPHIDSTLPSSGNNSLFGHSLGGIFTMYVLLKEPDLFTNYYCSDPAYPWNNRRIIEMAAVTFKNTVELNRTLWINGVEETYRNVGIEKMDSILKASAPNGLHWKISIYPNETHMSVRLKGIYDGLKYSFDGYNSNKLVEFHPMNGSLLEGIPGPVFLNGTFPNVYYTIDGSDPDTSSRQAPQMIEIAAPARLTVKWIGENAKYITTSKGDFVLSEVWPALQNPANIDSGGIRYSYYEGKWDALPDFTHQNAIKTGIADGSFSFENLPARSNFGCVFEGFINIDASGYYIFALSSRDGSRFFLGGQEIINNDGLHGSDYYKSFMAPLQKGFYPVRIEYFVCEGKPHLDCIYLMPNQNETVNLTFGMMYYK